jgi:aspartyl-tRNA(Asn)/glutamyl-tRNA(Gln) amidotransferase subunit B
MRTKEEAQDYRYFPEPDLLPLEISDEMLLLATRRLPELPEPRARRFVEVYGVAPGEARLVCEERAIADYFEGVARLCGDGKSAANWVVTEIFRELNDSGLKIDQARVPAAELADLIARIGRREISNSLAKQVLRRMWSENETAAEAVGALGATQVQDTSVIAEMVASVIAQHPDQVRDFRAGKEKIFGFLLGQVMKKSKGQADPDLARRLLTEGLK